MSRLAYIVIASLFGSLTLVPTGASAQDEIDQAEMIYDAQCAAPLPTMVQNCAIQKDLLERLKQQRLQNAQDDQQRSAQEAADAQMEAADAQAQASLAQSLNTIRSNRAAAASASASASATRPAQSAGRQPVCHMYQYDPAGHPIKVCDPTGPSSAAH